MTPIRSRRLWLGASVLCALALAACTSGRASVPATAANSAASAGSASSTGSAGGGATQQPDASGGTASGDIPDNAVFLTYRSASQGFSIAFVEGWQVTTRSDSALIRDKDSSEAVRVVSSPSDVSSYINGTDLPALSSQAGFSLIKHDSVKFGAHSYEHLAYHLLAPPDPVTGKQVPSTVDRYYVPGPRGLAIVSLSTPVGVDNVDAFRMMINSFKWG